MWFLEKKLVTSILANWHGSLGLRSAADLSVMFLIVIIHLPGPCQQVASISHIASWGSSQRNWRLVRTSWFIPTTKGNTIGLRWPRLQRFTCCPIWHPKRSSWNYCRLLTAQKSHTAAWSEAFPIASVRNLLSPDELRIVIDLRTGANIFQSTECHCGKFVDRLELHGLFCIKNAGCFPRHSAINSILKRSLTRIGLPSGLCPWAC